MKIQYVDINFHTKSRYIINKANDIIEEYENQGFQLTLRQLYYQFVARGIIANSLKEYNKLGNIINDARLAGEIDWNSIVDLTREMSKNAHWNSPKDIVQACTTQYKIDKWNNQENHVEVWVEKDALSGVIEPTCRALDINFFSCRGYTSQSSMFEAGQRLKEKVDEGKQCKIIHLGDHDPSGIDMTRDIGKRLSMFMTYGFEDPYIGRNYFDQAFWDDYEHESLEIIRIALNHDQVLRYNPPPNPAKLTDTRATEYVRKHGYESWELDALEPKVLASLITRQVLEFRDEDLWQEAIEKENAHKVKLNEVLKHLE